jgi:Creatinase/Prolidase N-terminal domain
MRRGLMAWDADEIPVDILRQRVARLQAAMAKASHDAMILYTNFIRSAAVSHLTAFSPYWADGVLLVPREGEPLFATTLSKRVGTWIQTVKPVGDLVNSPAPGKILGERLAASENIHRVAILELDAFPAGLYDEFSAALPGVEIVDGSETFAAARVPIDALEGHLLQKADSIARNALAILDMKTAKTVGDAVGAVEKYARLKGAEEVYVAIVPDFDADRRFIRLSGDRLLGRCFAIRATVAYKGVWVRHAKTYTSNGSDRFSTERVDKWFKQFLAGIDVQQSLDTQIAAAIALLPEAELVDWLAEAAVGTRPLSVVASRANAAGPPPPSGLILTLALNVAGMPWCGAGLASLPREQSA